MALNQRSSSYTNAEDSHLCHVYLDISQNPIIGINQSKDQFWSRVESDYHSSMPAFITQVRPRRSLQCRMQTLLTAIGKMRGCVRQVENLNPSGASEQDIFNRAKVLFAQDKNYKKGFKFDHVWPILKDIEKFADVNAGIQVGRMQHGNFASSQSEYSPTSDSPTPASPGLASFDFNMNDNDFGGTSTERPIGVRKAKFKKRNDEESSKFMEYMKEENQKIVAMMEKNNADRQLNYEIQMLRAQTAAKKVDVEELREENLILLKDLTQVTDPKLHEFLVQEQSRIMHKRTKQGEGSQNTGSGTFAQYFEHLRPSDDNFPEY